MLNASSTPNTVPAGFATIEFQDEFVGLVGPLQCKAESDGLRLGLMLEPRHGNPNGVAHGGCLVTLADMVMGVGCGYTTGIFWPHPTISMNCDFIRGARIGTWVEGMARITRRTQNFCFASCDLVAAGEIVLSASGVFKVPDLERVPDAERRRAADMMVRIRTKLLPDS